MKKDLNSIHLTADQLTEMMNILIHMIHSMGHRIDIDLKAIEKHCKEPSKDLKDKSKMVNLMLVEIDKLKKVLGSV